MTVIQTQSVSVKRLVDLEKNSIMTHERVCPASRLVVLLGVVCTRLMFGTVTFRPTGKKYSTSELVEVEIIPRCGGGSGHPEFGLDLVDLVVVPFL